MSTIKVDTIQDTSGNEQFTAKAWVNFNGTGTVAIRDSGNVSSITDHGTGQYSVSYTSSLTDANYAMSGFGVGTSRSYVCNKDPAAAPTTSTVRVATLSPSVSVKDDSNANVMVMR